jgi:ABC-type multidrug transport system ATPase subunit
MLRCKNLTVRAGGGGPEILSNVDAEFRPRALNAVIGPSGCGKTTLVKSTLRLLPSTGESFLDGRPLHTPDDLAGRVGFAQQFTNAYPQLTVEETFRAALDLTVADSAEKQKRMASVLEITGLGAHKEKRVSALSGGQMRRLGLGVELTLDPACMVCDEVTSGLDPNSEAQILDLLRKLVEERGKTFLCIIHNLETLAKFDWITVVFQGAVIFQGEHPLLLQYFGVSDALHLYDVMHAQTLQFWRSRWTTFLGENPGYYFWHEPESPAVAAAATPAAVATPATDAAVPGTVVVADAAAADSASPLGPSARCPGMFSQFLTLLRRRFLLFTRDTGYMALTLAITFGFPVIVVIFALNGLPEVRTMPMVRESASLEVFREAMDVQISRAQVGSLASGLIMFQVILLTLMGANNGGREIAAERGLYEKERLTGLHPVAYVFSKIVFVSVVACFQGAWMAAFVKGICQFPGPWGGQLLTMMGVCVSMSVVCLGFSAAMQSSEKASLLSIYLVGFQIPLSGVVLALPDALTWVCRPFINAYWGWAGFMNSMQTTRIYDAFRETNLLGRYIADPVTANTVLVLQAFVGLVVILIGCISRRPL